MGALLKDVFPFCLQHGEVVSLMAHPLASIMGKYIYNFWGRGCRPYGPPSLPPSNTSSKQLKTSQDQFCPIVSKFHLHRERGVCLINLISLSTCHITHKHFFNYFNFSITMWSSFKNDSIYVNLDRVWLVVFPRLWFFLACINGFL